MAGDEREELGGLVGVVACRVVRLVTCPTTERGRGIVQVDVEVVELPQLEPVGPVVRSAAVGVGTTRVVAALPVAEVEQVLADVFRGAVGPADDDRYHACWSGSGSRIAVDTMSMER